MFLTVNKKPVYNYTVKLNPSGFEVKSYVFHRLHKLKLQYINNTSKVIQFKDSGLYYSTYFVLSIGKPTNTFTTKLNPLGLEVRPSGGINKIQTVST